MLNSCASFTCTFGHGHLNNDQFLLLQQIAYEYAKRQVNLVLIARREHRLRGISENARRLGSRHVLIMAADVVKEDDCRRFINETIKYFGHGKPGAYTFLLPICCAILCLSNEKI